MQDSNSAETENKITKDNDGGSPDKQDPVGVATCYWQVLKRDTFVASLSQKGNRVNGKLSFDNFEKDGSSGMVVGENKQGIMKLWYSFESEGMKSVMEVWFKKQGDFLLRGTGNMNVKSDTSYFTDPDAVDFSDSQKLKKVDCNEVPSKYKQ